MRLAYVGTKYVITNAARTKFFAFSPLKRYSDTVNDPVRAEHFPNGGEAQHVIDTGKGGHWGAIDADQLYFVAAVEMSVIIEVPAPVVAAL